MDAEKFFTQQDRARIREAIGQAEKLSSGELRVYIEDECKDDVLDRAAFIFEELSMHETEERNGVLIYLAMNHRKLAIIGDVGIHAKVGDDFWKSIRDEMLRQFAAGKYTEGLMYGVMEAGKALAGYFPYQGGNDRNELSDDVVFGKG